MKKILLFISLISVLYFPGILSQPVSDTAIYLLTCGPGKETYSIYGHSAIRVVIPDKNSDMVYNWGVFDFNTPNFAWKFAKGRLDYYVIEEPLQRFLEEYYYEKRYVVSQRINFNPDEVSKLLSLIKENLKPENSRYKYDFFYDDCSTRIRDIIEKSISSKLLYPPVETGEIPTFRNLVGRYQKPFHWLQLGIDLIMGSKSDVKAKYRDRMFLPIEMKNELSEAVINRSGKMVPLLKNPETVLEFDPLVVSQKFYTTPVFIFTLILIIIIILSGLVKSRKYINIIDIVVFAVFSILSVLMIFFNFFTDHQQMKWNLNIIWLNPLIILCLLSILLKKAGIIWFRIVFYISVTFLLIHLLLPQEFNIVFLLLLLIVIIRSSIRSDFDWNPLSHLTKL